jgi:hypothetical protein
MVKESFHGQMEVHTMDNLLRIISKDMENIIGLMDVYIKDSG